MVENEKTKFFELLCLNNSDELKNWLISNGKSRKTYCPIQFVDAEEIEKIVEENANARERNIS